MLYKEIESKGYNGLINHSILQDGDLIVSFEDGEYKLYDKSYLKGRKVLKVTSIPKLDLNCYEGIEMLYKSQNIKMTTGRVKYYFILAIWSLLCVLFGIWYGVQLPSELQARIITFMTYE